MSRYQYKNASLTKLVNLCKENNIRLFDEIVIKISNIYKEYNNDIDKYTDNYVSTMEDVFNSLNIDNFILKFNDDIKSSLLIALEKYYEKIHNLRHLKFLSEEKKTIVFVGPNGCGKTTLLRHLIKITGEEKIGYYPADRLFVIDNQYNPERDDIVFEKNCNDTDRNASNVDNQSQTLYITRQINQSIALFEKQRAIEMELCSHKQCELEECITEKILRIWNELIQDRQLFCKGVIKVKTLNGNEYPIKYLSSGEKSILYFLSSILLKDKKDYYFIDEPENNLNPSIVARLWDIIEKECSGSNFVYLTHDSNFVTSRINSKLFWIEKYDGTEWSYKALPENDNLPQQLMVALVGNRQPVIFCESENEHKLDDKLFKIMFPEFKVVAVGGCDSVISKTKAYKAAGLPQHAYGIIDCDYKKTDYLDGMEKDNIFHLPFFEIENFLMSAKIVKGVISEFSLDKDNAFQNLCEAAKNDLISKKEQWIIRKIAFELRNTLFNKGVNCLNNICELKSMYQEYNESINIDELYSIFEQEIQNVIDTGDYDKILRYYDNKGMFTEFLPILKLNGKIRYEEAVFMYLRKNKAIVNELRSNYFPKIVL